MKKLLRRGMVLPIEVMKLCTRMKIFKPFKRYKIVSSLLPFPVTYELFKIHKGLGARKIMFCRKHCLVENPSN